MLWKVVPTAHDLAKWGSRKRESREWEVGSVRERVGNGPTGCRRQVLAAVKHSARSTWTAAAAAAVGGEGAVVQAGEEQEATMAHYGKLSRCA